VQEPWQRVIDLGIGDGRGSPRWHLPRAYSRRKGVCGARAAPRFQTVMCLNIWCNCSTLGDDACIGTVQSMQNHQETARDT
jgi:hypothetical protein